MIMIIISKNSAGSVTNAILSQQIQIKRRNLHVFDRAVDMHVFPPAFDQKGTHFCLQCFPLEALRFGTQHTFTMRCLNLIFRELPSDLKFLPFHHVDEHLR